jgi:hypothetical protein
MAGKNIMIHYHRRTGSYLVAEPRPWAKENQVHFPTYDFITNHPNMKSNESLLIEQQNSQRVANMPKIVLIQNLDSNLTL